MKIDKSELKAMAEKDDRELWESVTQIAAQNGFKLKASTPSHEEMQRLRAILTGAEKINMREGLKLLNTYKNKK